MSRIRCLRFGIAAGVIAAALAAPAADATTVTRSQLESGPAIQVTDDVGIQDNLSAFGDPTTTVIVDSASTPITAGFGCSPINDTRVQCPGAPLLIVALGAGADTFTDNSSLQEDINGNDGNDVLNAGFGNGTVNGNLGNDTIRAYRFPTDAHGPRSHTLNGNEGSDTIDLSGNRRGADTASGGVGTDRVTYAARSDARVVVTIDNAANDGTPVPFPGSPEADNVKTDVENLTGAGLDDQLSGSGAANVVEGSTGNDTINGLGGNDTLRGDDGNDVENGGAGDDKVGGVSGRDANKDIGADTLRGGDDFDSLFSSDGVTDTLIDCGPPTPSEFGETAVIDLVDPVPVGCESVQQAAKDQHPTVQVTSATLRNRQVLVTLVCPAAAPGGTCDGTVSVVQNGETIAGKHYNIRAGHSHTVTMPLRGGGPGAAQVLTSEKDTSGRPETTQTQVLL